MDTKQIEYILKIAEENNITRAAEKLFITQSALNQQLLKLEKELGTPLFHRSRTNWRPTEAGNIYIQGARELLRIKKITYNQIRDVANVKKGILSIGFTPGRGIIMFAAVYPSFHRKYPDITVEPVEKGVKELQSMIADDQLDIAFLTLSEKDRTRDEYLTLRNEEFVVAVPAFHPLGELAAPPGEPLAVIGLDALRYEPFVTMDKHSTTRPIVDRIFEEAGIKPNILFETRSNSTIVTMIQSGICCGVIPDYYRKDPMTRTPLEGVACFALPSHPRWQVTVSYKKGGYLNRPARYFIDLASGFWSE